MITFTSLFLALTVGVHPVEVLTGGPVAEIEFFLDDRSLGVREEPPWRVSCDFGDELLPHELVAIGRDAAGREIGRARQWVNLPRPPAEVKITLIESTDDRPHRARLSWTVVAGREPQSIEVFLDGNPLPVVDPHAIPLPSHDPLEIHYLRAELDFGEGPAAVAELVFGGAYADRVESEITAVPLMLEGPRREPTPESLAGMLVENAVALSIAAVDRGLADLVIVPDHGTHAALQAMTGWAPRMVFGVDRNRRVEFVSPFAEQTTPYTLFPHSEKLVGANLPQVLFRIEPPAARGPQRLAEAVAVAGVTAAAANLRRAVLLTLSDDTADASQITPRTARRYLEALRVPLFVWRLRRNTRAGEAWAPAVVADSPRGLQVASRKLLRDLERQRVAWVVGRHLPQRITFAPGAENIGLAGVGGAPR